MAAKRWHIPAELDCLLRCGEGAGSPQGLVRSILHARGVTDAAEVERFLSLEGPLHSPDLLANIGRAIDRVLMAIQRGEQIAIYGDYDADGITATVVMQEALEALGARTVAFLPHRERHGYGLHAPELKRLHDAGVSLVITVDCGIANGREIAEASNYGLDVIVTDHHEPPPHLSADQCLVNPKLGDYPFEGLAGVGVAYKFAQALLSKAQFADRHELLTGLSQLVAIGTVADVAPMLDENRVLVARGLRVLNGAPRLGLQALVTCASLSIGRLDEGHIGFAIGPRLNAAGRMAEAELAYRLLRTADAGQAALLAERLNALNAARQQATENALVALEPHLAQLRPADSLVLVHEAGVPAGIVGLVASRLCDSFDRPAIVFTGDGEQLKGSGRSVMGFNLAEALAACDDLLIRHGGHYLAAGLTVERELFPALRERLLLLGTKALGDRVGVGELRVDAVLGGKDIGWPLYEQLQRLRPFGAGNAEPVFVSRGLHVVERSAIGRTLGTLRLRLKDQSGGGFITAKGFGMGHRVAEVGETVDVAYNLSRNDWRGNSTLELNLVDFRPA